MKTIPKMVVQGCCQVKVVEMDFKRSSFTNLNNGATNVNCSSGDSDMTKVSDLFKLQLAWSIIANLVWQKYESESFVNAIPLHLYKILACPRPTSIMMKGWMVVQTKRQIVTLDCTRFMMVEGLKLIEIRNKKVTLDCTRSGVTLETEARHHCLKETSLTKRRRRWRTLM